MKIYETVIFLQGDDYDAWEAIAYPEREGVSLGWPNEQAGLDYLMQWEYGEPTGDEYTEPPWGGGDQTHEIDGYVMSWHTGLSYASLTRITERSDES